MGVYPEDWEIDVPELMRLWIAEVFLKPINGKYLEVVAQEYFNELLGRNLILVNKRGCTGETIKCKVHDLLVDVCVREAQKHKFYFFASHHNFNNPPDLNTQRRVVVHDCTKPKVVCAWVSHHGTFVRSLTSKAICSLWNLQTLHVTGAEVATSKIWKMSQLRHVHFSRLYLLDPHLSGRTNDDGGDDFVLENLQTLSRVCNLKFSEEVVKRIPNIKELGVYYEGIVDWSSCCLHNLVQLINLESLSFAFRFLREPIPSELLESLPRSLKELTLEGTKIKLGDLGEKISSLPHQVLKLKWGSLVGPEWETFEGQFRSLKYWKIEGWYDLKHWRTESWTHFPCLEHLFLWDLPNLKEIPSEIEETLKSIEMESCSEPTLISANEILKEQEDLGMKAFMSKYFVVL
ncbi:putative late blight resistance protein homolog r1b-17 [Phtheirospermum japonicum]|uniref:Putative late blight resistance protein homolog r1b-17 n=1 Tax=Phtheirospermum japonicum TaxID=374723 RepID=A0A830DAL7_9LAMI|nr:putative late blight resistance protein homolog r1b-17 [Phtheirospermum japonicum]